MVIRIIIIHREVPFLTFDSRTMGKIMHQDVKVLGRKVERYKPFPFAMYTRSILLRFEIYAC